MLAAGALLLQQIAVHLIDLGFLVQVLNLPCRLHL
jgi:hypothetical protein